MAESLSDVLQSFAMLLLEAAITVLVPVVVSFVLAAGYRLYQAIRIRLGAERLAAVEQAVRFVVLAAEQSGLTNELLKEGAARKAWAIGEAQRLLDERGLKGISVETLSTLIEAAVFDELNRGKRLPLAELQAVEP